MSKVFPSGSIKYLCMMNLSFYIQLRPVFAFFNISSRVSFCQPLSPSSQRRLKQLTGKHGSGKIYQVMGAVVGSRDLDLNLAKGELVAVISEADTRGDKRRWLVDAGGTNEKTISHFYLFIYVTYV